MKVFIAGVMQGNKKGGKIHNQDYRKGIIKVLTQHKLDLELVSPDVANSRSPRLTKKQASEIFFKTNSTIAKVNLMIAYVPEASMGTAIEMWEAWKNKVPIITISPLKDNWVVKILSSKVYSTVADFAKGVEAGELPIKSPQIV